MLSKLLRNLKGVDLLDLSSDGISQVDPHLTALSFIVDQDQVVIELGQVALCQGKSSRVTGVMKQ